MLFPWKKKKQICARDNINELSHSESKWHRASENGLCGIPDRSELRSQSGKNCLRCSSSSVSTSQSGSEMGLCGSSGRSELKSRSEAQPPADTLEVLSREPEAVPKRISGQNIQFPTACAAPRMSAFISLHISREDATNMELSNLHFRCSCECS